MPCPESFKSFEMLRLLQKCASWTPASKVQDLHATASSEAVSSMEDTCRTESAGV